MKLFSYIAAVSVLATGCVAKPETKVAASSTPYCQPVKMAEKYKEVIEADGSFMQATTAGLEFGQTAACGKKAGEYMVANPVEYKQVLDVIAKHNACMNDLRMCD